jgi:hypothetical protein
MGFPPVRVRQSKLRVLEQGLLLSSVLFQVCATCTREKGTEKGKEEGREGGKERELNLGAAFLPLNVMPSSMSQSPEHSSSCCPLPALTGWLGGSP